jgi:signal transduction histidine kinase
VGDGGIESEEMRALRKRIVELEVANQELVELNALKNQFLGMAAHDLRGPIGSIRGIAELVRDIAIPDPQKNDLLGEIVRASGNMLDLLNDLLDISSIESGQLRLNVEPVDLAALIEERLRLLRMVADYKRIPIVTRLQPVGPVPCDRARIAQVIDNLVSNAIKYSKPGASIEIELSQLGVAAILAVNDHGQGIPESELHRLFGAFSRLSTRPTGGERSTGLGLAIVKRIVEEHDGVVGVESRVGKGSSFRVILPLGQ